MHNLLNAGTPQLHFLIIRIAYVDKGVNVMPAAFGLKGQFATRIRESLAQLARGFFVALGAIINLERWSTVENERCRHTCISGAEIDQ
jgi:hypothetical protein